MEPTNFYFHYNFPGFSTGEVKPNRGTGRREVGHGNLAMRSIKESTSFTWKKTHIHCELYPISWNQTAPLRWLLFVQVHLRFNGCRCKDLKVQYQVLQWDLITDGKPLSQYLSDILGDEDHLGDMDFKVTGTRKGICATQMDLKVDGLPYDIMLQALEQARDRGGLHILS